MQFKRALIDIVLNKKVDLSVGDCDRQLLVCFKEYCEDEQDLLQLQQYKNICERVNFANSIYVAYKEDVANSKSDFPTLADTIESISDLLEKEHISCFFYSYFIYSVINAIIKLENNKALINLHLPEINWIDLNNFDYTYQTTQVCGDKNFGYGRYVDSVNEFVIDKGVLKKYKGKSPFVIVPYFVTSIASSAFKNNNIIQTIHIPNNVKKIGAKAFLNCKKLETVSLPKNVKVLYAQTFQGCVKLKRIGLSRVEEIYSDCFKQCVSLTNICLNSLKKIGNRAFYECARINNFDFIAGLEYIGEEAFIGCNIKFLILKNCTHLGNNAFAYISTLDKVAIDNLDQIKYIGNTPFLGCYNVSLLRLNKSIFYDCYSLFETSIQKFNQTYTNLKTIRINILNENEFKDYSNLEEVYISEDSNAEIGCFYNCTNLKKVSFSGLTNEIFDGAFYNCSNLEDLTINFTGNRVHKAAFYKCPKLSNFSFLDNVLFFDDLALAGADLTNFNFDRKFKYIGKFSFANSNFPSKFNLNLENAEVKSGCFHGAKRILSLRLSTLDKIENQNVYSIFSKTKENFSTEVNISYLFIKDNIYKNAFQNLKNIRYVEFKCDDGIIPEYAFASSGFESIKINGLVNTIEKGAFLNCHSINNLDMEINNLIVGEEAFSYCKNIEKLIDFTKIRRIETLAFSNCELKNLILLDNIEYIGKGAFAYCSNIENVVLPFVGSSKDPESEEERYFGYIFGLNVFNDSNLQRITNDKNLNVYNFYIPNKIRSVTVTASYINDESFNNCYFLNTINLPNIIDLDKRYFYGCDSLTELNIGPYLDKFSGVVAFELKNNLVINIDIDSEKYLSIGGSVYSKDEKMLYYLTRETDLNEVLDNIKEIKTCAVLNYNSDYLKLSNDLVVDSAAINGENIQNLYIGNNVELKQDAIFNLDFLNEITLCNNNSTHFLFSDLDDIELEKVNLINCSDFNLSNIFAEDINGLYIHKLLANNSSFARKCFAKVGTIESFKTDKVIDESFNDIFSTTGVNEIEANGITIPVYNCFNMKSIYNDLKKITINGGEINDSVFRYSDEIEVHLVNVGKICSEAFANTIVTTLYLENVQNIDSKAFVNSTINNFKLNNVPNYLYIDDVLYGNDEIVYFKNFKLDKYIIPKNINHITELNNDTIETLVITNSNIKFEPLALSKLSKLKNLHLTNIQNDTVRELFGDTCNLKNIRYLGTKVKRKFFANLENLEGFDCDNLQYISSLAFANDYKLNKIDLTRANYICSFAFYNCRSIKQVYINKEIDLLDYKAFANCIALESVTLHIDDNQLIKSMVFSDIFPSSVKTINVDCVDVPDKYFQDLSDVTNINFLNAKLKTIGKLSFAFCIKLKTIKVPKNTIYIAKDAFYGSLNLENIELPYLGTTREDQETFNEMFGENNKAKNISILHSSIAEGAFKDCSFIESLYIKNLKIIPKDAFNGLSHLKSITGINEAKEVGDFAFKNCENLEQISMPKLNKIGAEAFAGCSKINELNLGNDIESVGEECFKSVKPYKLTIGSKNENFEFKQLGIDLSEIRDLVLNCKNFTRQDFKNAEHLTKLTFGNRIDKIPDSFFENNATLKEISCDNIKYIGKEAFVNCKAASNFKGLNVEYIGESAFKETSLEGDLVFPFLKEIGNNAFINTNIKSIDMKSIETIGENAFNNCLKLEIVKNGKPKKILKSAFYNCSNLNKIDLSNVVEFGEQALAYTEIKEAKLSDELLEIPYQLFYCCRKLSEFNIPSKVKRIGDYAFGYTGIKHKYKIFIPDSVLFVGREIFCKCYQPEVSVNHINSKYWSKDWANKCKGKIIGFISHKAIITYR